MKKRIIASILITVVFAIAILSSVFFAVVNIKEVDRTKEILSLYNKLITYDLQKGNDDFSEYKINNQEIRVSIIDKEGQVLYDSLGEIIDNHVDREEVVEAFDKGVSSLVRFSDTVGKDLVYYATRIDDNTVIRTSAQMSDTKLITSKSSKYFLLIIIGVVVISIVLCEKLVKIIVQPVRELEEVTQKIANGDLNKRAVIYYNDEIGSLAKTFNEMADMLEIKISDSLDKQNKLEAILESMESGVIAITAAGKVMLINPYAKSLFGIGEDIIGKNISNYIIDHDFLSFIRDVMDIDAKEIKLFHPFEREIKVKKAPIIGQRGSEIGIVISIQDITDIKRLENMRSQFVANVSHELKTPLTSIKGFSETLRIVDDENTKNKFLDIIDKETDRLTLLIDDILILSNIENMNKLSNEKFNPNEVVEDVINMIKKEAAKKNISIEVEKKFNGLLVGDKDKFYQVVLNLTTNSIKYSNENGNVKIFTNKSKDKFVLMVKDDGIGIPKEDLPRIFERFYIVDKSRTSKSTGLGLAIVKHIVKLFNGEIFVESEVGKGSKFTVISKNVYCE
ncbi:ATP-binding protein [Clostridium sp. CAG:265]|uniref:sensor histidine kinase n=1 Tax=Clostridium sp. CAG:265 TaxID=1262787 RepID=UPI00033B027F|nr:ATP-binding protein [Clostridium sp. CAG:265]CDB75152.1 multi-sensor signal transduction histidine kinase [Clostridium sp. CAG:265]